MGEGIGFHGSDGPFPKLRREVTHEDLGKQDEIDRGVRDGVSTSDREEITEVRRENRRRGWSVNSSSELWHM